MADPLIPRRGKLYFCCGSGAFSGVFWSLRRGLADGMSVFTSPFTSPLVLGLADGASIFTSSLVPGLADGILLLTPPFSPPATAGPNARSRDATDRPATVRRSRFILVLLRDLHAPRATQHVSPKGCVQA